MILSDARQQLDTESFSSTPEAIGGHYRDTASQTWIDPLNASSLSGQAWRLLARDADTTGLRRKFGVQSA